ncbi:MAG: hypothetical protein ACRDRK_11355 [Pseudonocardia sp.]
MAEHHREPLDVGQLCEQRTQLALDLALLAPLLHGRAGDGAGPAAVGGSATVTNAPMGG